MDISRRMLCVARVSPPLLWHELQKLTSSSPLPTQLRRPLLLLLLPLLVLLLLGHPPATSTCDIWTGGGRFNHRGRGRVASAWVREKSRRKGVVGGGSGGDGSGGMKICPCCESFHSIATFHLHLFIQLMVSNSELNIMTLPLVDVGSFFVGRCSEQIPRPLHSITEPRSTFPVQRSAYNHSFCVFSGTS